MSKFHSTQWEFTKDKIEKICLAIEEVAIIIAKNDLKFEVSYTDNLICFDLYVVAITFTEIQELKEWKMLNQLIDCVEIMPSTKYKDETILISFQFRADKKINK